jgi:hypothetical protein
MGAHQSKHSFLNCKNDYETKHSFLNCKNDYEFVIKASKELEYILEHDFGAQGKGLHEKISNAVSHGDLTTTSNSQLIKDMRYLATIRNKLIHERGFDAIPNRSAFEATFTHSVDELAQVLVEKKQREAGSSGENSETCVIQ